jgi:signal transduction histidine kinase
MDGHCGQRKGPKMAFFAKGEGGHSHPAGVDGVSNYDEQLAQIIHDLKNPLSTIALEIDLMDSRLEASERFDAGQAIARIRRNVRFLDRLIHDLVDMCTLASGELALRRSVCELGKLLASVIERVVPSSARHRVSLEAREPIETAVDELRIERVVANLLDNALKYTTPSADIVVQLTRESTGAQVSVCDAGPGLSPAEIESMFKPYRRGATSDGRAGSGLGLFLSKQIVEAHGGQIGVESVRGAGARFFFALPLS